MRYSALIGAVTLGAVATAAAVAVAGSAQTAGRTIVLQESTAGALVRFTDTPPRSREDRGAPRASLGDRLTFATRLRDPSGARAGRIEATCSTVVPGIVQFGAVFLCTGVVHLADGDLLLATRFTPRTGPSDAEGAIIGGTGAYTGARGTFSSRGAPATDTLTLLD